MTRTTIGEDELRDLIDRLESAIKLATSMDARGKHPTNIYNIADEAVAALKGLIARRSDGIGTVSVKPGWAVVPQAILDRWLDGYAFNEDSEDDCALFDQYRASHRLTSIGVEAGGDDPASDFARWVEQGPSLALAAGLYVGIKVYASEDAARKVGDIS